MSLSPEERAQVILDWVRGDTPPEGDLDFIASAIREAMSQAVHGFIELSAIEMAKARAEALEEAALLSDQHRCKGDCDGIAGSIRALKTALSEEKRG